MLFREVFTQLGWFNVFFEYSKTAYVNENVEFVMLVRWLNPALGRAALCMFPDDVSGSTFNVLHQINYIFNRYVAVTGKSQVNLDARLRTEATYAVGKATRDVRHINQYIDIFDEAYQSIFDMLEKDVWPRFCVDKAGQSISATDERKPKGPAALHVPPPIVFNAPAPAPAVVNAPAAAVPQAQVRNYMLPVPPPDRRMVKIADFDRSAPLPRTPVAAAPVAAAPVAAAQAHAAVQHPLHPLPRPPLNESFRIADLKAPAKHYRPLPPTPPVFITPEESLPDRPRANSHHIIIIRPQGPSHQPKGPGQDW